MAETQIGLGKSARRGYRLAELDIVPSRRTRNPAEVDTSWQIDALRFDSPIVAAEFCGTSITSQGGGKKLVQSIRGANPHIRFADGSKRGYVLLDFGRDRLEARLRVLDAVTRQDAAISTAASFTVLAGRPGIAKN